MTFRRTFNAVGPFLLALAPLLVFIGSRVVAPAEATVPWPAGVVILSDDDGTLMGARVLDPVAHTVATIPVDLVVQPPNHGETRIETLFATGKTEEIRAGLERTLGQALPFLLLVEDGTGDALEHNLGEHLPDVRSEIREADRVTLETRRILRPDGTYSVLLGDRTGSSDPLSKIDPSRVFVRVLFTKGQRAAASALATALQQAGFTLVDRQLVSGDLPTGVTVRYRLDPVIAEAVAAAVGADARIEEARDPETMRGADALVIVN